MSRGRANLRWIVCSHGFRSLTQRQRQLLQDYADDVEGKTYNTTGTVETSTSNEETKDKSDNNGTAPFTSLETSPVSGWVSSAWNKLKELMRS